MAQSLGTLLLDVKADTQQLVKGFNKAQTRVDKFSSNFKRSMVAMAGAYLSFQSVATFSDSIKGAVDLADKTGKLAEKLGTTSEELSELAYAGQFVDVSMSQLNASMSAMIRRTENFKRDGTGASAKAMRDLGISAQFARDNFTDTNTTFRILLNELSKVEDTTKRTAIAQDLFSKSASDVVRLSNLGADGLERLSQEGKALGVVIGSDFASASAKFNDDLTRIGLRIDGITNKVTKSLLPALDSLLNFVEGEQDVSTIFNTEILEQQAQELGEEWRKLEEILKGGYKNVFSLFESKDLARDAQSEIEKKLKAVNEQLAKLYAIDNDKNPAKEAIKEISTEVEILDDKLSRLVDGGTGISTLARTAPEVSAEMDVQIQEQYKAYLSAQGKANKQLEVDLSSSISNALTDGINGSKLEDIFENFANSLGQQMISQGVGSLGLTSALGAGGAIGVGIALVASSGLFGGSKSETMYERSMRETTEKLEAQFEKFGNALAETVRGLEQLGLSGTSVSSQIQALDKKIIELYHTYTVTANFNTGQTTTTQNAEAQRQRKLLEAERNELILDTVSSFTDYSVFSKSELQDITGITDIESFNEEYKRVIKSINETATTIRKIDRGDINNFTTFGGTYREMLIKQLGNLYQNDAIVKSLDFGQAIDILSEETESLDEITENAESFDNALNFMADSLEGTINDILGLSTVVGESQFEQLSRFNRLTSEFSTAGVDRKSELIADITSLGRTLGVDTDLQSGIVSRLSGLQQAIDDPIQASIDSAIQYSNIDNTEELRSIEASLSTSRIQSANILTEMQSLRKIMSNVTDGGVAMQVENTRNTPIYTVTA